MSENKSQNEPNYQLAKKVFLDFNDFNLKNIENDIIPLFVPQSFLPYPKKYIKAAWYIFREFLFKEGESDALKKVEALGVTYLFSSYPDYKTYKENLKMLELDNFESNGKSLKERFKDIYGVYEISEEEYNKSLSSKDVSDEKIIHDFGILPNIVEDEPNY